MCFSQFHCSQRLPVHQHSMSFVLNVVLMWSRISSNNVLLSDLQPCCSIASMCTACLASIRFKSVSHSSLLVVTYQVDLSATMKMRTLCEINEIIAK